MLALKKALESSPIVYITRDIERALGLPLTTENYYIVSNHNAFAKSIAQDAAQRAGLCPAGSPQILLIKEKTKLDTRELLEHPETIKFINRLKNPQILVFKNTPQIEKICRAHGWKLLNPKAELANRIEEKISQVEWLEKLARYLPPHTISELKDVSWKGKNFILQFNRAHTGLGTVLITSKKQLQELQAIFPDRPVRLTQYITGPMFTNNNIVWGKKVFIGNINYQITGLRPFTDQPFATIGNDWALPHKLLDAKQIKQYKKIVNDIGKKLARDGWKGLFGIDVIMNEKTGKLFLIEINARQPASTTYESQLQQGTKNSTTFEAHLASLLNLKPSGITLAKINDGAQIIQRVLSTKNKVSTTKIEKLKKSGLNIFQYANTKPGEDLIRIQSQHGIMAGHNKFNKIGKQIFSILK